MENKLNQKIEELIDEVLNQHGDDVTDLELVINENGTVFSVCKNKYNMAGMSFSARVKNIKGEYISIKR